MHFYTPCNTHWYNISSKARSSSTKYIEEQPGLGTHNNNTTQRERKREKERDRERQRARETDRATGE